MAASLYHPKTQLIRIPFLNIRELLPEFDLSGWEDLCDGKKRILARRFRAYQASGGVVGRGTDIDALPSKETLELVITRDGAHRLSLEF